MNVFIMTIGTRGDLELFLTLGRELSLRGHQVNFGTSRFYSERVLESKLDWQQIGYGTQEELLSMLRSLSTIKNTTERTRQYYKRCLQPLIDSATSQVNFAAAEADYFISNLKLALHRGSQRIPGAFVRGETARTSGSLAHGPGMSRLAEVMRPSLKAFSMATFEACV